MNYGLCFFVYAANVIGYFGKCIMKGKKNVFYNIFLDLNQLQSKKQAIQGV